MRMLYHFMVFLLKWGTNFVKQKIVNKTFFGTKAILKTMGAYPKKEEKNS